MGNEPSEREWLEGLDPMTEQQRRDEFFREPWQLTDEERRSLYPHGVTENDLDDLAEIVASIKASAYQAGQVAALTEAADAMEAEFPEFPLGDGTFAGPPFWVTDLRARAAEVGGDDD